MAPQRADALVDHAPARAGRGAHGALASQFSTAARAVRDDARSLVTELVANAIEFGRPPIQVRMERKPTYWLLEVADAGVRPARGATRFRQAGWGLRIVELLAESWGTGENGSRVWCRISAAVRAGTRRT